MKNLWIVGALAALLFSTAAIAPAQAKESLGKRRAHVEKKLTHKRAVWAKKQAKWVRKHPRASAKQVRNHSRFQKHTLKEEAKLVNRDRVLSQKIAHKHAVKHK